MFARMGDALGLWDKVKSLFGKQAPAGALADAPVPSEPTSSGPPPDPFSLGKMLELGPDELRAEAPKVGWWSEWTWRRDVIPPLSDPRTALLDRAIVLRGLATQAELEELHRVGDEHLLSKKDATAQRAIARVGGDAAVAALRAEK